MGGKTLRGNQLKKRYQNGRTYIAVSRENCIVIHSGGEKFRLAWLRKMKKMLLDEGAKKLSLSFNWVNLQKLSNLRKNRKKRYFLYCLILKRSWNYYRLVNLSRFHPSFAPSDKLICHSAVQKSTKVIITIELK